MPLLTYTLKRTLATLPLLLGVVTIVFFLARLLPGSVTDAFLSPSIPQTVREQLREQLGLDRPAIEQYVLWLRSAISGDFGYSFTRNGQVLDVLWEVFPNTLILGAAAILLELTLGIAFAVPVFFSRGTWVEKIASNSLLVVYALPSFWVGIMLLIVFSYGIGLFPSSQMFSSGGEGSLGDLLSHLVLPACTAALPAAAGLARYLQKNIRSVMKQEHVVYARSMGLPRSKILGMYVLPNAISPVVSLIGIEIGILFSGVLVTEVLFSWPGMGQLTIAAIRSGDYPLILGCTLFSGVIVVGGNLVADVVNAVIDPRLRPAR